MLTQEEHIELLTEEYKDLISNLKRLILGDFIISNRKFTQLLFEIFKVKYSFKNISINTIAEIVDIDFMCVDRVYQAILYNENNDINGDYLGFLGDIIKTSDYSGSEVIRHVIDILEGKENNGAIIDRFKPEDLLNNRFKQEIENNFFRKIFREKMESFMSPLGMDFNPATRIRKERAKIKEKEMLTNNRELKFLEEEKVYFIKEIGDFLKFYDTDTLKPVSDSCVHKRFVVRELI